MFISCRRYVQCPYFRDICCSVALIYYHFLRPFLVAVGSEGVEGYKHLSHLQLCSFYPDLIDDLRNVAKGEVELLLQPTPLPFLRNYANLAVVSHKGHHAIFESIFEEIAGCVSETSTSLKIRAIKSILPAIAEHYQATFRTQTEKFYLDDGTVKKMLDIDSHAFDGVPINSLASEHQVAEFRHGDKIAPTAHIETIGNQQIIAKSGYLRKKKTRAELRKLFTFARKDQRAKLAMRLFRFHKENGRLNQERRMQEKQAKKVKATMNRKDCLKRCRDNHNGPVTSLAELEETLAARSTVAEKQKILTLEIFFQRDSIYIDLIVPDKSIFKAKRKHDSGRMLHKPLEELTKNLAELLSPDLALQSAQPIELEEDVFVDKMQTLCKKIASSNSTKLQGKSVDRSSEEITEGNFVAVYWQEHDGTNCWYIGKVSRVIPPGECYHCREESEDETSDLEDTCYEVIYLKESSRGYSFDKGCSDEYHTVRGLILSKVVLDTTKKNMKLVSPLRDQLDTILMDAVNADG